MVEGVADESMPDRDCEVGCAVQDFAAIGPLRLWHAGLVWIRLEERTGADVVIVQPLQDVTEPARVTLVGQERGGSESGAPSRREQKTPGKDSL
jgi:hypothetical protein